MLIGRVADQKKFDILRGAKGFIQASKEDEFHVLKRKPAGFQLLHLAKEELSKLY